MPLIYYGDAIRLHCINQTKQVNGLYYKAIYSNGDDNKTGELVPNVEDATVLIIKDPKLEGQGSVYTFLGGNSSKTYDNVRFYEPSSSEYVRASGSASCGNSNMIAVTTMRGKDSSNGPAVFTFRDSSTPLQEKDKDVLRDSQVVNITGGSGGTPGYWRYCSQSGVTRVLLSDNDDDGPKLEFIVELVTRGPRHQRRNMKPWAMGLLATACFIFTFMCAIILYGFVRGDARAAQQKQKDGNMYNAVIDALGKTV